MVHVLMVTYLRDCMGTLSSVVPIQICSSGEGSHWINSLKNEQGQGYIKICTCIIINFIVLWWIEKLSQENHHASSSLQVTSKYTNTHLLQSFTVICVYITWTPIISYLNTWYNAVMVMDTKVLFCTLVIYGTIMQHICYRLWQKRA